MRFVFVFLLCFPLLELRGQSPSKVLELSIIDFSKDEALPIESYLEQMALDRSDALDALFKAQIAEQDWFEGDYLTLNLVGIARAEELVIVFDKALSRLLIARKRGQSFQVGQTGTAVGPLEAAYKSSAVNAYPLKMEAYEQVTLIFRVPSGLKGSLIGEIKAFEPFERRVNRRLRVSYIFAAVLLTFAIYNWLLAFLVKQKVYFLYSYYIFAFCFYAGLTAMTLIFPMALLQPISIVSAAILISAGAWFSGEFLGIEDHFKRTVYFYRFLKYSSAVVVPILVFNWLFFENLWLSNAAAIVTAFIGLSTVPFWLLVGFRVHWKGHPNGRLFLLTNIPLLIGCCIFIVLWLVNHLGLVALSAHMSWVASMVLFCSVLLQLFLFSYVIGNSIKKLQGEKLEIQREINQKLEIEVADRTASLRAANESIEEQKSQLTALNRVKDNLFSIVSHDLRNPLNSVKGLLELIRQKSLQGEELGSIAGKLESSMDSTMNLLDNLLFWAKSQQDGIQARPTEVQPKVIIDRNLKLAMTLSKQKELSIKTELGELSVFVDKDMLDLVVRNLLSNAIKFTPSGGEIRVKMIERDAEVVISFEDNGVGMSQKVLDELFSPEKNHTSYGTNNEKGYGLGLKLCKDFVEINGGQLTIESTENQGSIFTISLPSKV